MSMIFTHYDRTQMCDHSGMLGRKLDDGSRVCARCGATVPSKDANQAETFTAPVGRKTGRLHPTRMVR